MMKNEETREVVDSLWEIVNVMKEIREELAEPGIKEELTGLEKSSADDFKTELTTEELNALLFSPIIDKKGRDDYDKADNREDIKEIKKELFKLKERYNKDMSQMKKYVNGLCEMWGRHELEMRIRNKEYSNGPLE